MMNKLLSISRVGQLGRMVATAALLVGALGVAQQASAQVAASRHNLGTSAGNPGLNKVTTGTDEICVFCHTPHASNTAVPAPLWNKQATGSAYTTYTTATSSTLDGQVLAVGSNSLACLSCHDGVQAMDNIINAPGSGGYDVTGGGATGLGYTWNAAAIAAGSVDAAGNMLNGPTTLAMLGTDLTNDHPIGVQYCGGGITGVLIAGCTDVDYEGGTSGTGKLQTANINAAQVWWVDTAAGVAGTRQKTDMILYTRTFPAGAGPSVECGSCHDAHKSTTATFLRIANTGSAVCLACHVK